jgi:hypothetical protein
MQQRTTENRTITGKVVEVDNDSLVIETASGQRMTFKVDHDLTTGAQPITVGSQVRVEYRGETELELVNVTRSEGASPRPETSDRPEASAARPEEPAARPTEPAARPAEPAARPADPAARRDPGARPGVTATQTERDPAARGVRPGAAASQTQRDPSARPVRDPGALPATAGPLPILLLAGLSLLGGGLGLSRLRR